MVDHRWHFSSPAFHLFAGYLNSHGYRMPAGREEGNNLGTAADAAMWLSYHVTAGREFTDADKRHLHYLRLDNTLRAQWAAEYIDSVVRAEGETGLVPGAQVVAAVRQAKAEYDQTPEAQRARQTRPLARYAPPAITDPRLSLPGEDAGTVAAERTARAKAGGAQRATRTAQARRPGSTAPAKLPERE